MSIARYRAARTQVSNEQLLILLLREAVTRLTRLEESGGDAARWIAELHHVRLIVLELEDALDPTVPGAEQLVARLSGLYSWCMRELIRAGRERDAAVIRPVRVVLTTLLDGWTEAIAQPQAAK
jgi:flagellar biosynthetic protein FliS